jgi:hypothetical protein
MRSDAQGTSKVKSAQSDITPGDEDNVNSSPKGAARRG